VLGAAARESAVLGAADRDGAAARAFAITRRRLTVLPAEPAAALVHCRPALPLRHARRAVPAAVHVPVRVAPGDRWTVRGRDDGRPIEFKGTKRPSVDRDAAQV